MDLGSVFTLLGAAALVWKVMDLLKFVEQKDWRAVRNQVEVMVLGVIALFVLAQTDFAQFVPIAHDFTLATVNGWSIAWIGLSVASVGSVGYDFKKSVDNTDTAKTTWYPPKH